MSIVSNWPLPPSSVRYIVPKSVAHELNANIVSRGLYPLAFGYYEKALNHQIERQNHLDNLVIFCADGEGTFQSEHFSSKVTKNDILLIPKGCAHSYQASQNNPWSIYWVHLDGHLFEQFMDMLALNNKNLLIRVDNPQFIVDEFQQLLSLHDQGFQINSYLLAANLLKKLLSCLALYSSAANVSSVQKSFDLEAVKAFMEENITNHLSLEQIASRSQLSKFHFAKKFQQAVGISPMKYFIEMKIRYACGQLDSSGRSIKDIATTLGFDDPYYFSRLFKKTMGMSPKQYRLMSH